LPDKAAFTKEAALLQNPDDGFFALLREHTELHPARLDIKHGSGRIPLRKNQLSFGGLQRRLAVPNFGKKGQGIERYGE
jgi:hypothetical protein